MGLEEHKPKDSVATNPVKWPVGDWDRYQFCDFIGEGSMGRVYKAFDPRLKRYVALKFLRDDDLDSAERFLHEAQAQARIEHDHVCKIYEVGDVEGKPYIAMQYIEGPTLKEAYPALSLEQRVRLIVSVTRGVHEAHRLGLIHRDIKPTNILLEFKDGRYKPYILDFGLVREVGTEGLTITGEILGTPSYMAPEQALGHSQRIDRRTDVYSLGATVYEILSGKKLYQGSSGVDIVMQLLEKDPPPLRNVDPNIPRDLNTIVMKCLEREPVQRYQSARELADDLERYLDGEPIHARPSGALYKASKKIRKNKVVAITVAVALVLVSIAGLYGLHSRRTAAEQARIAQQFGQDVERIESVLRYAHMLPLHNITREKSEIHKIMNGIRSEIGKLGALGIGPGNYALGRGYFALQDYSQARSHLERAWNSGYRTPEIANLLGRTLGELYQKELEDAERIESKELREARKKSAAREFRDPALDYLRQGLAAQFETSSFGRGIIALYEKRLEEGLAFARTAFQQTSWYYEAKKLEGDIYIQLARQESLQNEYDKKLALYEKAGVAYKDALELARSDPSLYLAECTRQQDIIRMKKRWKWGQPLNDDYGKALLPCDKALTADPENSEAYLLLSRLKSSYGGWQKDVGTNPLPALQGSIEAAQKSIRINPKHSQAYLYLGNAFWIKADYESTISKDPSQTIDKAIQSLKKSASLDPNYPDPFLLMGNIFYIQADRVMSKGHDPNAFLDQAIANYKEAVKRENFRNPTNNIGSCYMTKADYEYLTGSNPVDSLNMSIHYFKEAYHGNWQFPVAHLNAAWAYRIMAQYTISSGGDPSNSIDMARKELSVGFEQSPNSFNLNLEKSRLELIAAKWANKNGKDPSDFFKESEDAVQRSIEQHPENADAYLTLSQIDLLKAEWRLSDKAFAGSEIKKGIQASAKALSIRADFAEAMAMQAKLYFMQIQLGKSTKALEQKAHDLLSRALQINPLLKREYGSLHISPQNFDH